MVWFYVWAHNASALVTVECAIELAGFGVALTIFLQQVKTRYSENIWDCRICSCSTAFLYKFRNPQCLDMIMKGQSISDLLDEP